MMHGISAIDYPGVKSSESGSRRYDHSGADQILKRQDAIAQLAADRLKSLYEGDIVAGLSAGRRIQALRDSIAGIAPVRVDQEAFERVVSGTGGSVRGASAEPKSSEAESKPVRTNAPRKRGSASITDVDGGRTRLPGDTRPQYGIA